MIRNSGCVSSIGCIIVRDGHTQGCSGSAVFLGIEIGGTKLQLGVGAGDGVLAGLWRGTVDVAAGPEGIRQQVVAAVPGLLERSEEHTSELQSHSDLVCRLLLEKKKQTMLSSTPVVNRHLNLSPPFPNDGFQALWR